MGESESNGPAISELTNKWVARVVYLIIALHVGAFCLFWVAAILEGISSARRSKSQENIEEIGRALLQYEQEQGRFPDAWSRDEQGEELLSWRVHLLPDLGDPGLYARFDLSQPWDSDENKKLILEMPEVFQNPDMNSGEFKTNYLLVWLWMLAN